MKTPHQLIDLVPVPTFLIDKTSLKIDYSNNKGLILTHLNEQSIKKCKISDFIGKEFIAVGEYENCSFKISNQTYNTGNLSIQPFDKEYLIVSFWSLGKESDTSMKISENDDSIGSFHLTKAFNDISTDSIFIMQDGIIKYANPNLLQVSGYKLSELIGIKFTEFVPPNELEKVYSIFVGREKGENTPVKYESSAKLRNGKYIDVEVSVVTIIFNEEPAYQVVLRDITKRKIAERKYRNIVDFAPIGFYQTSKKGDFLLVNNEMVTILGFDSNEDLIKRNISEFYFSIEEREKLIKQYDTALWSEVKNVEIKFKKKDGSPIWVLMTARAIKDENQETISYDGFIINISDRKKKENVQKILLNLSKKSLLNIGLKEYLGLIHNELKHIMKAENFYVALYEKTTDTYTFPYHVDLFEDYSSDAPVFLHNTLTDFVRESKKGLLVTKAVEKELHEKYQINVLGISSPVWLGVPLIDSSTNEAIGVLALQDYNDAKAYNEEDLQALEIIVSSAGLFTERVRNNEKLRAAIIAAEEGEKRYKSLFYDNKSVMIIIDPKTGYIVDANKSACDYYGYSYQQITKLKIDQINMLPEEGIKVEMYKSLNAQMQHFNFKHRLANGELRDVEVYSGKVSVSGSDLLYSTVHDVTERKLAEDKVFKLTASIEQSPVSIFITDLNGVIEYVNPYIPELTGYDYNELIGKRPNIFQSGVQSKAFYKELWDIILTGQRWEGDICNKKKNGDFFWEHVVISPLKNKNDEIINFINISEDITDRKRMIDELILAKVKAEESDRLKSAFLANMSHEIRTPMNGILGFTNLLLNPDLTDETKEAYIQIIHQSGERMLNTVTDIIEISKIEAGIVEVKNSPLNINESIKSLVAFFQPQAHNKGLVLSVAKELPEKERTISTDLRLFESIVTNLIRNAIKYTDKGEISVSYEINNGFIQFCIHDTGIGIPEHRQKAIFNRFEQADIADVRAFQGSGLGLAIAKSYVEMIGGNLWVESVEGKGSQFYFTVPFLSEATETVVNTIIENDNKERINQIKLLIVEDDDVSVMLLRIFLTDVVENIIYAQTGEQAIELCKTNTDIDIVLMDIKMPGIDGYETTKRIREFNKEVIIIAQTAYAMAGDEEKAIEFGCNDYITKPIDKNEFLEKIRTHIKSNI